MVHKRWCPRIESQRVMLRPLVLDDAQVIYVLRSDAMQLKYVETKPYENVLRAERFIRAVIEDTMKQEICFWAVVNRQTQEVVGTVCLWNFSEDGKTGEIGYELLENWQGKGLMQESVKAVIQYAFTDLGCQYIRAITHRDHMKSRALLDKQAFVCLGIANAVDPELDEPDEMLIYVLERIGGTR